MEVLKGRSTLAGVGAGVWALAVRFTCKMARSWWKTALSTAIVPSAATALMAAMVAAVVLAVTVALATFAMGAQTLELSVPAAEVLRVMAAREAAAAPFFQAPLRADTFGAATPARMARPDRVLVVAA